MENFRLKISKYDEILNKEVYDNIIKDFNQFEDATKPYNGKVKKTIFDNGTKHKREQLIESVFSMKEVCADMFNVILSLVDRLATKATIADNITDIIEHSFNKLSAELSSNLSKAMVKPEINRVESEDKEKHVIILESKNPEEPKFDETAWNEVVKKKLSPKLKNVPIEKAMLCKNGKGCIFVSDKKVQKEVKSALEQDDTLTVTSNSKPQRTVNPKIKIFNLDTSKYNDKTMLRSAILEKNTEVNDLVSSGSSSLDVLYIDEVRRYAIIKVSPNVRALINKSNKIFIDLQCYHTQDHFQPLQCFACQRHGHTRGSPDCCVKESESICLYCAGNHRSKSCTKKDQTSMHRCANCLNSSNALHKANANHKSTSLACPFVIKEINSLVHRTAGLNQLEAKNFLISVK